MKISYEVTGTEYRYTVDGLTSDDLGEIMSTLILRGSPEGRRLHDRLNGAVRAMNGKRQTCRKCLRSCIPAVTLTFDGGARRLHWCEAHRADADRYREQAS